MAAASIQRLGTPSRLVLSAEMQALCLLTRSGIQHSDAIAKAMASPELDWTKLLGLAKWHGTAPLLMRNLPCAEGAVPGDLRERLSEVCHTTAKKNLLMSAELVRLCARFQAAEIRTVCYKGPALGAALYGDAAMRPCGDLDLILSVRDLDRARGTLKELGYTPLLPLNETQQEQQAHTQGALVFANPKSSILVDLHFSIVPQHLSMNLPIEPMLDRAREFEFAGAKVLSLQAEDLLLVLCVHGSKHYWERLLWICDIAHTVEKFPQMDWELVLERAERAGIRRVLLLGMALAEQFLAAELPEPPSALWQQDRTIPKLMAGVAHRLEMGRDEPAHASRWLFMLRSRERYRDRLAAIAGYASVPRLEIWNGAKRIRMFAPAYMITGAVRAAARSLRNPRRSSARSV